REKSDQLNGPRRSPDECVVCQSPRGGVRGQGRRRGSSAPAPTETEFGRMDIQSTRFGTLVVDDERVINFPNGLLGFPEHKRFALIQTGEENYFFWLQSVDEPNLAFVVADPGIFFKGYEVPLRDETRQELQLAEEEGAE